jgi:hypothetical protein
MEEFDSRNSSYASAFVGVVHPRQSLVIIERELSHPQQVLGFEALAEQELRWLTEAMAVPRCWTTTPSSPVLGLGAT